jgi:hypothetical protein
MEPTSFYGPVQAHWLGDTALVLEAYNWEDAAEFLRDCCRIGCQSGFCYKCWKVTIGPPISPSSTRAEYVAPPKDVFASVIMSFWRTYKFFQVRGAHHVFGFGPQDAQEGDHLLYYSRISLDGGSSAENVFRGLVARQSGPRDEDRRLPISMVGSCVHWAADGEHFPDWEEATSFVLPG